MENIVIYDTLGIEEIELFSKLINTVFDEFVGNDYSVEGNNTFKDYIKPQNIMEILKNSENKFFVAKYNNEIIGVLQIRNKGHIALFFVKKEFHNKGIGKNLFGNYLEMLKKENIGINIVTVNSSIYAENIYSKMGFIKVNEIQEKNGIKYIPMEYKI